MLQIGLTLIVKMITGLEDLHELENEVEEDPRNVLHDRKRRYAEHFNSFPRWIFRNNEGVVQTDSPVVEGVEADRWQCHSDRQ